MTVDIQACIAGDKRAWDAFVDRWSGIIYAAVQRTIRTGDRAAVEDVVQDVFIRLIKDDYRLLRGYDPGRASLSTWLTLVARSTTIDHLRRIRPAASLEHAPEPTTENATDLAPGAEAAHDIPLHLLTGRQRLVLSLLFDRGLAVEDVAGILGVDAQTIRSTKHKALSRLRETLEQTSPEDSRG